MSSESAPIVADDTIELVVFLSREPKLLGVFYRGVEFYQHVVLICKALQMELS
jgi:hypothetical protein